MALDNNLYIGALPGRYGTKAEATFYASLTDQLDREAQKEHASWRSRFAGSNVSHGNASLLKLAALLMLFCGGILLICALGALFPPRSVRLRSLRPSRLTLGLAFASAIGALLSSAVLFVSYWPHSELLRRFVSNSDDSGMSELSNFLGDTQVPLGARSYLQAWDFVFYFWLGVTLLCVLALLLAVLRHLQHSREAIVTS